MGFKKSLIPVTVLAGKKKDLNLQLIDTRALGLMFSR